MTNLTEADRLNSLDPYELICEQTDDLDSRWNIGPWHPSGLHAWNGHGINIVATDWCNDNEINFGVYTDAQMEEMATSILWTESTNDAAGVVFMGLMAKYGDLTPAERASRPDPIALPAPLPSLDMLLGQYMATVRLDPDAIRNVAGVSSYYDHIDFDAKYDRVNQLMEIYFELTEQECMPEWTDDNDEARDALLGLAAGAAINECRRLLDLTPVSF